MRLSDFKVLSFDCYGTLIDWESGILDALTPLAQRAGVRSADGILEAFARQEAAQEAETPAMHYSNLLAAVHGRIATDWGVHSTAEEIGSYKPAIRNFECMIERLNREGFGKADILPTAESQYHDHAPTNKLGLASAWIHRRHGKEGAGATFKTPEMPRFDYRFTSLTEFVEAHKLERN